jgi:acetoin utilization deacetylase AcuC-like enzyme
VVPNVHPRIASPASYPRSIVGRAGYHFYDLSCPLTARTWPAILWSAHSASEAALAVTSGAAASAYALCRPPGHHAGAEYGGGFCYLNNAAIAAEILRGRYARVAVLDVDVHHCNGTQDIFYARSDVLVVSLHGDPAHFYPFYWGYAQEVGAGDARGANLNLPLARGLGDDRYLEALGTGLDRIRAARSDALVVSVGLDAYELDPLSFLKITTEGFRRIGAAVGELALPTVLVQEGGYFCQDLGRNIAAFLHGFESSHRACARSGAQGATT